MPRKSYQKRWPVPEDLLEELRFRFFSDVNASPTEIDEYHPHDLERVREDDWFASRYLLHHNKNVDDALKMLKESLKFRKEYKVNTLKRSDLPEDYFNVRAVINYNKDKKDHTLVVIRTKTHFKNEEMRRQQQEYFLYWLERAIKGSDWGIVSILFDCTGAGVSNLDMEMIRFILNCFKKYYPWALSSFFVVNMPWFLSAFWKMVKAIIPQQHLSKIFFVDNNTIKNYIEADQLPISLGGKCMKLYEPKEGVEDWDDNDLVPVSATVKC